MSHFANLQQAVISGNERKILEILQKKDINLRRTDKNGNTLLHLAFRNKESRQEEVIKILKIFLVRGIDINVKNKQEKTILHLAVERRMRNVINFCLRKNADLHIKDKGGNSIAHFAIEEEHKKFCRAIGNISDQNNTEAFENESSSFVDWMVSRGFDFFLTKNSKGLTPLYSTIRLHLLHILMILLKRISEFPVTANGQIPLLYTILQRMEKPAYCNGPVKIYMPHYKRRYAKKITDIILEKSKMKDEAVQLTIKEIESMRNIEKNIATVLAQRIININIHNEHEDSLTERFANSFQNWTRDSPLKDKMTILRNLIRKCADLNERDGNDQTLAEKLFLCQPTIQMLEILKDAKFDFHARLGRKGNFLHLICKHGTEAGMIDFVMNESSGDVNVINSNGETPLLIAVIYQNELAAKKLIEYGANVYVIDKYGTSPLVMVCQMGQIEVLKKMLEYGAELHYRNEDDKTLLHLAAGRSTEGIVELLIKNGLDVNARDSSGKTPLHFAMKSKDIELLCRSGAYVDAVDYELKTPLYDALCEKGSEHVAAELLKFGADLWCAKVFDLTINCFDDSYTFGMTKTRQFLKRHLLKMIAADMLDKESYTPRQIVLEVKMFLEHCQAEVELLKTIFVNDRTSLYDLLHKSLNRLCSYYLDNEKLKDFVENVDNEKKFHNYYALIVGRYNEAEIRKSLLELAMPNFNKYAKMSWPKECTDEVFNYLRNMDIVNFNEAIENATVSDSANSSMQAN